MDSVQPKFPQRLLLFFFVAETRYFRYKFLKAPDPHHPINQLKRVCVPLVDKIEESKVAYLSNLLTAPKKSRNSSFLTTSMIISANVAGGNAPISFLLMPES